jgi:hypothetical protein
MAEASLKMPAMERTAPSVVKVEHPRCPYCHADVLADEPKQGCRSCMAWHHEECFTSNGGKCATCGAQTELVAPKPEPVLAREVEPIREPPRRRVESGERDVDFYVGWGLLIMMIGAAAVFPITAHVWDTTRAVILTLVFLFCSGGLLVLMRELLSKE